MVQRLPAFMEGITKQTFATPTTFGLSPTEKKIKEIATQKSSPKEPQKLTRQDLFDDAKKIVEAKQLDKQTALTETLKYYQAKGLQIEGVDIDQELQGLSPQPEPVEEEIPGLDVGVKTGEAISGLGEGLKFESQEDDSIITSGLKFLGNLPGDTIQIAGDIVGVASDPLGTAKSILDIGQGISDKLVFGALDKIFGTDTPDTEKAEVVNAIGGELKKLTEDPEKLKQMAVENPADILFAVTGGLNVAKNSAKAKGMTGLADKLQKAENITNPIKIQTEAVKLGGRAVGASAKGLGEGALTVTGVATGLSPDTIKTIFKNPDIVKSGITREGVANKVVGAIDDRITDVGELGKGYNTVKTGRIITNADEIGTVKKSVLDNFDTKELTKKDQSALADAEFYISKYDGELTDSNILALRQQLDSIKYDESGNLRKLSKNGNAIVTQLRGRVDEMAKSRIEGLSELDKKYASEIGELTKVKKMIFDRNGDLKDGYIGEIARLLGPNKEMKLERIKKLVPEIESEINAVKALENVEFAKGRQIGAYLQGGGMVGVATGVINPATAVVGLMLSSPTIVSNMVRALGYSARTVGSITEKIKNGVKLTVSESVIVGKAIQEQMINKAGDLADNIADKTGARAKFMDDRGTGISGKIDDIGGATDDLIKEAKKYDSADEFVKDYTDKIENTKEFKEWVGNKQYIKAYHGSPESFDKFDLPENTGVRSGAYDVGGLSFATKKIEAEPFSRQYSKQYYKNKEDINYQYKEKLKDIEKNIIGGISKDDMDNIITSFKKEFPGFSLSHISKDEAKVLLKYEGEEKIKKILGNQSFNNFKKIAGEGEEKIKKLDKWYKSEIENLDRNDTEGDIYEVYIKYDDLIKEKGENIGFSSAREELVGNLNKDEILYIKDADTGQYIGDEIIVSNPDNIFISKSKKRESQLKEIYNQANK